MNESKVNSKEKTFYIDLNSENVKFKDKIVNVSSNIKIKPKHELSHIKVSKNDELRQNMVNNLKKTTYFSNSKKSNSNIINSVNKNLLQSSVNVSKITTKNNSRESSKRNILEDKLIKVTRKKININPINNLKINVKRNDLNCSNYHRNNQENCNEIKELKEYESYVTNKCKKDMKDNLSYKSVINSKNELNIKQIAKKYYQQLAKNTSCKNNGISLINTKNERPYDMNKSQINIIKHKKDIPGSSNIFTNKKKLYFSYNNSRNNSLLNLNITNNTQYNQGTKLNTQNNTNTQETKINKNSIKKIVSEHSKIRTKNMTYNKNYSNQSYSDLLINLKKDFLLSSNKSDHLSPFKNKNIFYNIASKRLSKISDNNYIDKTKNNVKRNTKLYKQTNYELNKSLEEYLLYEKRINMNSRNQGKDIYDLEENDKFSVSNQMKDEDVFISNEIINGNTNSKNKILRNTDSIEKNVNYLNQKSQKDIEKYKLDNSLIQFYKNNSNCNLNDNSNIIENLNSIDLDKHESIKINKKIKTNEEINENKILIEKLNINSPEELHIVLNLLFIKTKSFALKFENLGNVILSGNNSAADFYIDTKCSNKENGKDQNENNNLENCKNSENLSVNKHGENNLEFYDSDAEINKKCRYK